jgi:hypothetical protein
MPLGKLNLRIASCVRIWVALLTQCTFTSGTGFDWALNEKGIKLMKMGLLMCIAVSAASYNILSQQERDEKAKTSKTSLSDEAIKEAIRIRPRHEYPPSFAKRFDENAVPVLLEMLQDESEAPFWTIIMFVLGNIGNEACVLGIIQFLEMPREGEVDDPQFRGMFGGYHALGVAARKSDKRALEYLLERSSFRWWEEQEMQWHRRGGWDPRRHLWYAVIGGLGSSAQPEAVAQLEKLFEQNQASADLAMITESLARARAILENKSLREPGNKEE